MFKKIQHIIFTFKIIIVLSKFKIFEFLKTYYQLPLIFRILIGTATILTISIRKKVVNNLSVGKRLSMALMELGPTFIKLGQFLSTRPDIVGSKIANDLSDLQDRVLPFKKDLAIKIIQDEFNEPITKLFNDFSEPIAAASIAQVHFAKVNGRKVAIKILRPGIKEKFSKELDSLKWISEKLEEIFVSGKRLSPTSIITKLTEIVKLELDLRFEAAAASEMKDNTSNDEGFYVPDVIWEYTNKKILTLERIEGIPIKQKEQLIKNGHDLKKISESLIQHFLKHAIYYGFFHADMHQGNLFIDKNNNIVAVDFGIMGRMEKTNRRNFAEILYGFIQRDYKRIAEVHFEAGYVSDRYSIDDFAQALRSVGEPVFGQESEKISMGKMLTQLFDITALFDMKTQTELLLIQKTMVVIEGVARDLYPKTNLWDASKPIIETWLKEELSPGAKLKEVATTASLLAKKIPDLPDFIDKANHAIEIITEHQNYLKIEEEKRNASNKFIFLAIIIVLSISVTAILN